MGDDAGQVGFEFPGEGGERFDAAFEGAGEPAFPGGLCLLFGALFPQALEVVREDVDGQAMRAWRLWSCR